MNPMKTPTRICLALVLLALAACATNDRSDKITKGFLTLHRYISVTSEKVGDRVYRVVANGAVVSRAEDVELVWNEFAQKVAGARSFTKDSKVEDYTYEVVDLAARRTYITPSALSERSLLVRNE
jgi:hypothetical protein